MLRVLSVRNRCCLVEKAEPQHVTILAQNTRMTDSRPLARPQLSPLPVPGGAQHPARHTVIHSPVKQNPPQETQQKVALVARET